MITYLSKDGKFYLKDGKLLQYPPLPKKGDLLNIDLDGNGAKQYRVLSLNGNVAKLLGMDDISTSQVYNATSKTTTMGTLTVQQYADSDLDTYLNTTWYNTLSDAAKAAIVSTAVIQDAWTFGNAEYSGTYGATVPGKTAYKIGKYSNNISIGERNIFSLSVQDVIDYLNDSSVQVDTTAILRNVNIWKMFWNIETSPKNSGNIRLNSANTGNARSAWIVSGSLGYLNIGSVTIGHRVRPAFNIDLNKIDFSKV